MSEKTMKLSVVMNAVTQQFSQAITSAANNFTQEMKKIGSEAASVASAVQSAGTNMQALLSPQVNTSAFVAALKGLTDNMKVAGQQAGVTSTDLEKIGEASNGRIAALSSEIREVSASLAKLRADGASPEVLAKATEEARVRVTALAKEIDDIQSGYSKFRATAVSAMQGVTESTTNLSQSSDTASQRLAAMLNMKTNSALKGEIESIEKALADMAGDADVPAQELMRFSDAATARIKALKAEMAGVDDAGQRAANGMQSIAGVLDDLKGKLGIIQGLVGAALGGQVLSGFVGQLVQISDGFDNTLYKIKNVTAETGNWRQVYEQLLQVSLRTYSSLESTASLYQKLSKAGQALNITQQQTLALTESVNQAVQLSGVAADNVADSLFQFIQGLQSGVLRGDEFNSMMEQTPRLAQALADGLGVAQGELKKLADAGELTADKIIPALMGQAQRLNAEFSELPPTIGRAIQTLTTNFQAMAGEMVSETGVARDLAAAIQFVGEHLSELANIVYGLGKAWLAYKTIAIATTFIQNAQAAQQNTAAMAQSSVEVTKAAAAVSGETAALNANTAAQRANTAARLASNTATAASGAAMAAAGAGAGAAAKEVGLAAGAFGLFKSAAGAALGLIGGLPGVLALVVMNAKELGTWIGEGAAKLMGYGKAIEEAEARSKEEAEATRQAALQKAAWAQEAQKAADAALGLNERSKAMVSEFQKIIKEGGLVAEAIKKIQGQMDLTSFQGITDAITALDALRQKGELTAQQVQQAIQGGLAGIDLGTFEANARATFQAATVAVDGMVISLQQNQQEAERLKMALDAIAAEALARVGLSVQEVQTGFSTAFTSAQNDTAALVAALDNMGASASVTSMALAKSFDKQTELANTEEALTAVIEEIERMGAAGKLAGDDFTEALDKAKDKLDEIRPGISSLAEAMHNFGMKSKEELQAVADKSKQAWETIRNSATTALADKIRAFEQYRAQAIAANNGVESSEIAVQRQILQTQAQAQMMGQTFTSVQEAIAAGVDPLIVKYSGLENQIGQVGAAGTAMASSLVAANNAVAASAQQAADAMQKMRTDKEGWVLGPDGNRFAPSAIDGNLVTNMLMGYGYSQEEAYALARKSGLIDSNGNVQIGASGSLIEAVKKVAEGARGGKINTGRGSGDFNGLDGGGGGGPGIGGTSVGGGSLGGGGGIDRTEPGGRSGGAVSGSDGSNVPGAAPGAPANQEWITFQLPTGERATVAGEKGTSQNLIEMLQKAGLTASTGG